MTKSDHILYLKNLQQEDEKSSKILFNLLFGAALAKADPQRSLAVIGDLLSTSLPNPFMVVIAFVSNQAFENIHINENNSWLIV